jgi:uncharacterized membrane protein YfcA
MSEAFVFSAFLLIALLYSIVGLGGASSYVAVMVLLGVPQDHMPKVALTCNLIVVTAGAFQFARAGHFSTRVLIPFALASAPVALYTGTLDVPQGTFKGILAATLLLAGLHMLITRRAMGTPIEELSMRKVWLWGMPMGAVLGAIAGIVGIGGGIFLAPLLSVLQWGNARQIAATASAFVMITSVAALAGHLYTVQEYSELLALSHYLPLYLAVLMGGIIGSKLGARFVSVIMVRCLTAILALVVATTLLYDIFSQFLVSGG